MGAAGQDGFDAEVVPLLSRLRAVAHRMVRDRGLAEDAVQEALLRAYRFRGGRRGEAVWPWLRQIVARECWRLLRRRAAQAAAPLTEDAPGQEPGPDEPVLLAEEYAEVRRAVLRMPAGYQRVLRLRHGNALGEREIAAILGLPPGTVRWRMKRAHDHLRLALTRRHVPPLAATLREAIQEMRIRVSTERPKGPFGPPPPGVESSGFIGYETATLDAARAAIPEFRLPTAFVEAHPDLVVSVGSRGPDATSGPGEPECILVEVPNRLRLGCRSPKYLPAELTECFPGARIGVDEDTQVGGRYGHWTEVDSRHWLWWFSASGALWHVVSGRVPPEQIRRIAESVEGEAAAPVG